MQIVLLSPRYPPMIGGAEIQAQRLARALNSRGVRVTILTQSVPDLELRENDAGVQIVRGLAGVSLGPLWGLTYMLSCYRWLRKLAGAWDIVQNQQVGLHSWVSVLVARQLGRLSVLRFACSGEGGDLATMSKHRFGPAMVEGLRAADGFIALTSESASEVVRYSLPAGRVVTIPNGVDLASFEPLGWPSLAESEPIRLLFVGRLTRQKGLDVLLRALSKLRGQIAFTLRVVGAGDEAGVLRQQTQLAGLDGHVEFRGNLTNLRPEYAWSEVVVIPSRFEGMPNVALEALSSGRPVLGTRVGGTAEIVKPGVNGWLVPSEDADALADGIARMSLQRDKLCIWGVQGRLSVEERYSLDAAVSKYMHLYERLLSTRSHNQ